MFPGQNPCLDRCSIGFIFDQKIGGYFFLLEDLHDTLSCLILPHKTHRNRVCPKRAQIEQRISPSAQRKFLCFVTEDEHRSFSRDPACRPIDVFVQDQIAPDRHFFLRKTVDDCNKVPFVFFHWTFVSDFYQIWPKRSMPPEY